VKRSSERAGDESADDKDRSESDHSEAMRPSGLYGRGKGFAGGGGEPRHRIRFIFMGPKKAGGRVGLWRVCPRIIGMTRTPLIIDFSSGWTDKYAHYTRVEVGVAGVLSRNQSASYDETS
jgi:hypothetical protein